MPPLESSVTFCVTPSWVKVTFIRPKLAFSGMSSAALVSAITVTFGPVPSAKSLDATVIVERKFLPVSATTSPGCTTSLLVSTSSKGSHPGLGATPGDGAGQTIAALEPPEVTRTSIPAFGGEPQAANQKTNTPNPIKPITGSSP